MPTDWLPEIRTASHANSMQSVIWKKSLTLKTQCIQVLIKAVCLCQYIKIKNRIKKKYRYTFSCLFSYGLVEAVHKTTGISVDSQAKPKYSTARGQWSYLQHHCVNRASRRRCEWDNRTVRTEAGKYFHTKTSPRGTAPKTPELSKHSDNFALRVLSSACGFHSSRFIYWLKYFFCIYLVASQRGAFDNAESASMLSIGDLQTTASQERLCLTSTGYLCHRRPFSHSVYIAVIGVLEV